MGTEIKNASNTLTAAAATGTEYFAVSKAGWSAAYKMSLSELNTYIGSTPDKIEEGNSSVEVVDIGTGDIRVTIDGTLRWEFDSSSFHPDADNLYDIGKTSKQIRDI